MPRPRSTRGVIAQIPDGRYKVRIELSDGSFTWHTLKEKMSESKARDLALNLSAEAKEAGTSGGRSREFDFMLFDESEQSADYDESGWQGVAEQWERRALAAEKKLKDHGIE